MNAGRLPGLLKEMGSALSALQGMRAKDPGQGRRPRGKENLWEERGLLKKGGGPTQWHDKTEGGVRVRSRQ